MHKDSKLKEYLYQFLTEERIEQFEKVLAYRTNHFAVGLENIFQPHNANAVIRSCDCFGVQNCHVIESINKFSASKGVSKGAIKWVDVHKYDNTSETLNTLKSKGYQIVATTPHKNDCSLADFDITKKSVFFFGAEKKGLSDEVMQSADVFLKIPMVGHTESLNISVSAAIILQYVTDKLRATNIKWQLTEAEKEAVRLSWAKISTKKLDVHLRNFEG
ncbi:MAG: RNA methyltransferase [Chitinophagales bacterium]|nr:RNA methyltransferase [Chitinophagales bacterium]